LNAFRVFNHVGFFSPAAKTGPEMKPDAQLKKDMMEEPRREPGVTKVENDLAVSY